MLMLMFQGPSPLHFNLISHLFLRGGQRAIKRGKQRESGDNIYKEWKGDGNVETGGEEMGNETAAVSKEAQAI